MSIDFSRLKERQRTSNIEALTKKLQEAAGDNKKDYKDEREWKLKADDAGNGFAVIRFLPSCDEDCVGFVKKYTHGYQNAQGRWFIENCPTTLGQNCPVCEANATLWNSGSEASKKVASKRKRKLNFYSNILVVKDPASPENEGKVFLYRYGQKIFDKIKSAAMPDFEDEKPVDAFNMFDEGANFKLKMKRVSGFPNYDSSLFDVRAPISTDDEKIKEVYGKVYSLKEYTDPKEYRSYEDLKARFDRFESGKTDTVAKTAESITESTTSIVSESDDNTDSAPWEEPDTSSTTDDGLDEFQKLLS